jgi:hypothetical protein
MEQASTGGEWFAGIRLRRLVGSIRVAVEAFVDW